jgi:hypothetical protein
MPAIHTQLESYKHFTMDPYLPSYKTPRSDEDYHTGEEEGRMSSLLNGSLKKTSQSVPQSFDCQASKIQGKLLIYAFHAVWLIIFYIQSI